MRRSRCSIVVATIVSLTVVGYTKPTVARAQPAPALVTDSTRSGRDVRGGGGGAYTIASRLLGETRRIGIVLPSSYTTSAQGRRYPVTIVLDGEVQLAPLAAVNDELTRNGQIPESIIIAVENTNRLRDLTPPGLSVSGSSTNEGGDRFLDFLEQELLPAVDRQFRGANPRVLIGHSSGGILATYAAATRTTYRCIIALDTPTHLGENWLANKLIAHAQPNANPLRYVSYESKYGWSDERWKDLETHAPTTWQLHREQLTNETHESMPMLGMYLGLRQVYRDYASMTAPVAPTTSILSYYDNVSIALGAISSPIATGDSATLSSLVPPRRLLTTLIEDLLMEGRGAQARRALELQTNGYGAPPENTSLLSQIAEVESHPPMTETVEGLLATPFPTVEAAAALIGEWSGDVWMNRDELTPGKPRNTLRIAIKDGRVVGEFESRPAPNVVHIQPLQYLVITPSGFSFGYMNGMRPRGVLVHDGKVANGAVTGTIRFGGVAFAMPDDMPPIQFSLTKRQP